MSEYSMSTVNAFDGYKSSNLDDIEKRRNIPGNHEWKPGIGLSRDVLDHGEYKYACERLVKHIKSAGWNAEVSFLPKRLHKQYMLTKITLDIWDSIPISKCLSKEDILISNLIEGPAFAVFLKKARNYSYINYVGIGNLDIPEEYILPGYEGYDSLPHEAHLIHWLEETSDIDYSFLDVDIPEGLITRYRAEIRSMLEPIANKLELSISEIAADWIKGSKTLDVGKNKRILIRDALLQGLTIKEGYWGAQAIMQVQPGGVRDTAIADPDTLAKIKCVSAIGHQLCHLLDESAMTSNALGNSRINRVTKRKLFHHLDFKKMGLSFPRVFLTTIGDVLEELTGQSFWYIKDFKDLFVEIKGNTYSTKRGYMLGWANELATVAVIGLLRVFRSWAHLPKLDFVVFNDDVLIGDNLVPTQDLIPYCNLVRLSLMTFFQAHSISLSVRKVYSSNSSQFLEEYLVSERDLPLDMRKRGLGARLFAKAFLAKYPWQTKMYASVAMEFYESEDTLLKLISTKGYEFHPEEGEAPYEAGGYTIPFRYGLNASLDKKEHLALILQLKKVKVTPITEKVSFFNEKKSYESKSHKIGSAYQFRFIGEEPKEAVQDSSLQCWANVVETNINLISFERLFAFKGVMLDALLSGYPSTMVFDPGGSKATSLLGSSSE